MYRTAFAATAALLALAVPAAAFWGQDPVGEPHAMLALGAALVVAASYSRGRRPR